MIEFVSVLVFVILLGAAFKGAAFAYWFTPERTAAVDEAVRANYVSNSLEFRERMVAKTRSEQRGTATVLSYVAAVVVVAVFKWFLWLIPFVIVAAVVAYLARNISTYVEKNAGRLAGKVEQVRQTLNEKE
jgi:hypothetical protein